jgi:hypothetical protein
MNGNRTHKRNLDQLIQNCSFHLFPDPNDKKEVF